MFGWLCAFIGHARLQRRAFGVQEDNPGYKGDPDYDYMVVLTWCPRCDADFERRMPREMAKLVVARGTAAQAEGG